jgi:hypothetical protein
MEQMTVGMLVKKLIEACHKDPSIANKKIVVADDNEGNGYHGMFYDPTTDAKEVKANIEASNGLYDSNEMNAKNLIILG